MWHRILVWLTLATLLQIQLPGGQGQTKPDKTNETRMQELITDLDQFAKTHQLSHDELWETLFELVTENQCKGKAGIGILGLNRFVDTRDKVNAATINHVRWTGKPSGEAEALLLNDSRIAKPGDDIPLNSICVVLFSSDHISMIDFKNKKTATYKRW
ncbi:MAG TPA: hypothetical protein V6C86_17555 [Oculatellaceae cyanobacterium]